MSSDSNFRDSSLKTHTRSPPVVALLSLSDLLRGHVDRRADVGGQVGALHELRKPKVTDLDLWRVMVAEQCVIQLQIAVCDIAIVAVVHCVDALLQYTDTLSVYERSFFCTHLSQKNGLTIQGTDA